MLCKITNGKTWLRTDNKGKPISCSEQQAQLYDKEKAANILKNLPKTMQQFAYHTIDVQGKSDENNKINNITIKNLPFKEEIVEGVVDNDIVDDVDEDDDDLVIRERDNPYHYTYETTLEKMCKDKKFNIVEFFQMCVNVFSEMDDFINNMRYFQKEMDLRILDLRHFNRDEDTKLNAVQAAKLSYFQQVLERKRKTYKMNKNYALLFEDVRNLRDKSYIHRLDEMSNSKYRNRRLSNSKIKDILSMRREDVDDL